MCLTSKIGFLPKGSYEIMLLCQGPDYNHVSRGFYGVSEEIVSCQFV